MSSGITPPIEAKFKDIEKDLDTLTRKFNIPLSNSLE